MPRLPILPTIVVLLAVATMIALGVWQLDRRGEKRAAIARYSANLHQPEIAFPNPPIGDEKLFRRAHAMCVEVTGWQRQGGKSAKGVTGWRQIARCRTGAEGPALLVDMGLTTDPNHQPDWRGGPVRGWITQAPDARPFVAGLFDHSPRALMLISEVPLPGLQPGAPPDLSSVPNNHLAYAVQWFLFAGVAIVIYLLALRRRQKRAA